SNLAITAVQERIQAIEEDIALQPPDYLMAELEQAVCLANDLICQRNDQERRHDRQRMGTTLVMALARSHEIYITHIGDSRVYWITRSGCYQITVDDDVASREVRLGYALYRDAVHQPVAGSLVQALGMSSSATLHPTVQRLILDEEGVFLLCSDGLSENDRVEECWETEILPILDGKVDLANACQRLVEIGNIRNGHDNVTVGLLYYHVTHAEAIAELPESLLTEPQELESPPTEPPPGMTAESPTQSISAAPSTLKTQILPPRRSPNVAALLLGILLLIGLGSVLAYLLFPGVSRRLDPLLGLSTPPDTTAVNPTPVATPTSPNPTATILAPGTLIQIRQETLTTPPNDDASTEVRLQPQPGSYATAPSDRPANITTAQGVPGGSTLQVLSKQGIPAQGNWVKLKLCALPVSSSPQDPTAPSSISPSPRVTPATSPPARDQLLLQPGESGWIEEAVLTPWLVQNPTISPNQVGTCSTLTPEAPPSPASPSSTPSPSLPASE
ncbi:MAG TPA: protein phosphatase 2C domain-containing protein, partial [Allocoleopsis sp.]